MGLNESFEPAATALAVPGGSSRGGIPGRIGGQEVGIDRIDPSMARGEHEHNQVMEHRRITRRTCEARTQTSWSNLGSITKY